ncbi:MAG: IS1595 family transposase [Boseongicola sp. SB0677_bin_26]|nr:IS1595 family transposase [Boseongicola sp. SB0665_bin_10]MYG28618.1 IS1595 family transposase [Boseongicola sp. SB0677_bin_26]
MHKAPGKSHREGISLIELMEMFPDEETAAKWFESVRWPNNDDCHCPHCGSFNVQRKENRKPAPFRCRDCRAFFSVRQGSVMEHSRIPLRKWAIAIYLNAVSLKGVSSMRLHRDLKITQKSAWFMAHRLREAFASEEGLFAGPVEVDESYFGGKRKNMSNAQRKALKKAGVGRGSVGKTAVVGMKDRDSNKIVATPVQSTDAPTLQGFVEGHTEADAKIYSDEAAAYKGIDRDHEWVNHSVSEYVRDQAHTNGMESFWATIKRAHDGTFHHMSAQHLHRYVNEFAGRHNIRDKDTIKQMQSIVAGMIGKRLMYRELAGNAA